MRTALASIAPVDPHELRRDVNDEVDVLLLTLSLISLAIGAVGIINTTLVAVLDWTSEMGLRRVLGAAHPRHLAFQFLTESWVLGTVGGVVGSSASVIVVLAVAVSRHWTAVLDPRVILLAPLLGSVVGLVGGAYPALRAACIEPIDASRR